MASYWLLLVFKTQFRFKNTPLIAYVFRYFLIVLLQYHSAIVSTHTAFNFGVLPSKLSNLLQSKVYAQCVWDKVDTI